MQKLTSEYDIYTFLTMTTKYQSAFVKQWQMLLVALFAWLLPEQAMATYVDETYNYSVTLNGTNMVKIQVPVYDQEGADCWVSNGNLKVTWDGQTKTLFHWLRDGDTDSDSKDIWIHFSTEVGGEIDVTQGNSTNHFTLTSANGDIQRLVYRNSDGKTYTVYALWRLPYDMLGKKLTFTWDVQRDGNSRSKENVKGLNDVTITMPKAADVVCPQVTEATLAYSEQGKLEIPWFIASTNITSARYEYTDYKGRVVSESLPNNMNSGTIYLDATEPHNNFRIIVSYRDNNNYLIENIPSKTQNLKMIHTPVGFTATPMGDHKAKVKLMWNILYPNSDDLMDVDFFEVQRSLTGEEGDFTTIGTVEFALDEQNYTYIDSTLVDAIAEGHLTGGGTLEHLTYRIRRTATQTWGWNGNPASASASCIVDDIHLLTIANYTAKWEDERAYTVRVGWEYGDEYNAVWDKRAEMKLRVTSVNRKKEPVDTAVYVLTAGERDNRYKVISLSRPCVDYHIEMFVDRGTSPLCTWDKLEPYYFPIRSAADWQTFDEKIASAKGERDINARLYADITITSSVGFSTAPFRGHFDGNGHTLTVNMSGFADYCAPFRYVKDASIKNLKVEGNLSSSSKFTASIVAGVIGGTNVIENCASTATIHSSITGDATNGGLVAYLTSGTLSITNCYFGGKFTGNNCYANGGLIGYMNPNTTATVTNCYFAPTEISTQKQNCATYARCGGNAKLIVINSYCSMVYEPDKSTVTIDGAEYMVLRTSSDWDAFRAKVEAAKGNSDVNAIMDADFSTVYSCAMNYPFRGVFNGNGHTLTANIEGGSEAYIAPFRYAKDCTIKNLVVDGEVKGGNHSAGLVGSLEGSPTVRLENLYLKNRVTTVQNYVGGVVGHTHDANIVMEDSKSYGYVYAIGSDSYGGAVFGWGHGGSWTLHRVYEYVSFSGINHAAFSFWYNQSNNTIHKWGYNDASTTCVSYHDFDEVKAEYRSTYGSDALGIFNRELSGSWDDKSGVVLPVMDVLNIGADYNMDADALLNAFGGGWKKENNTVTPVVVTYNTYSNPSASTCPTFYHESMGKIGPTLKTETRQSSVLLIWETDDNPVDYFMVLRREKGAGDNDWTTVESNIDQKSYEDKSVSPLMDYEYKVRAINDCEGISYTETEVKEGACKHTGLLEGYVRFNDGTGVNGIDVEIVPSSEEDRTKPGATKKVRTDESGYFMADDLSYFEKTSITYNVTPVSTGNIRLENGQSSVTFNNTSNHETVKEFTITNGLQFNAYVMYDGTSIPVKGVRFRVNDNLLHNAKGDYVETDFEGHVQFQVLNNTRCKIQAVMENHTFTNGGWYKSADGVVLTDKVGQTYFYDSTLVKLTGRVVGGKDQGDLPLDHNLSRNNLGDDLSMVLTLEGDNTSWLVYDNLNPGITKRNVTFNHPAAGGHKTTVEMQRKRMVVKPDSLTGEYVLMLPPVRWKVQQVYCEGYSTLFQDGQVGEVIDLTECLIPDTIKYKGSFTDVDGYGVYQPTEIYNYRYNRIYHAPVEITYRQLGYDTFDYFGDKSYLAQTLGGNKIEVPLASPKIGGYTDYINPYETYTHTAKLNAQQASHAGDSSDLYDNLFDGNPDTKWCVVSNAGGWWVNFKADKLVSVSSLDLTTGNDSQQYDGRNPKGMRLLARATEADEWTTLLETDDAGIEAYNLKTYNYKIANRNFYQFFRLEILTTNWGKIGTYEGYEVQLGELALICRGKADSKPEENHGPEPFFGDKAYYTFGYPVFSLERKYPIQISVVERYPWNGVKGSRKEDLVRIGGGKVIVHNGMKNGLHQELVKLDSLGQGVFLLEAEQTTRLLTKDDALRTLTMTLEQDGTTYEAVPLKGYILNMFATSGSKDAISIGEPLLVDILRDPPGSSSTATLSKGSKLKFNYTVDMKFKAGVELTFGTGTALDNYSGIVAGAAEYGLINSGTSQNWIDLGIIFSGSGKKGYSYTMNVAEDITTSGAATMVSADADVYIGVVQNMIVTPMSTIRAIPDSIYKHMLGRLGGSTLATGNTLKYGSLVHIAEGRDANDSVYHLVRDESLAYGPQVTSQFAHSQKHIVTELLPKLANEIHAMLYTGTKEEAQKQANATGKAVYWSKVASTHEDFGVDYEVIRPTGVTGGIDELAQKQNVFLAWVKMIGENEYEKLSAYDLVANYDVDGGSKVTYNETFESEYSVAQNINYPFTTADYFGDDGANGYDKLAKAGAVLLSQPALASVFKMLAKKLSFGEVVKDGVKENNKAAVGSVEMKFAGVAFKFGIVPVVDYSSTGTYGTTHNYTRKESFTLSMDPKSHLNLDVFRVRTLTTDTLKSENADNFDVFHNANFDGWLESVNHHVSGGVDYSDVMYPRSFIYRTRSGATCNAWEDERRTLVYRPGTLLDERTKKISNPKITLDRQSMSGIAINDPARFKVYLTNESEQPESATGGLTMFTFFLDEETNPNGAKVYVDGTPLNGNGMTVVLYPSKVVEKTMEVYAGSEFDYEGITLGVASSSDFANTQNKVKFDVHYLRQAGPVNISSPGDKWVMNTDAPWNEKRGWFLPITIDGFNKYQKNFDHIEFQYKESMRGENSWTNLCSYYADSTLMAQANGVREMIPENGNIITQFYGEGTVMEKAYDLRAVLYCRDGNSFLTTPSKIITGVKDTRRPQLFGMPEPKDGIITNEDNIVFNFSEDIEYNYLNDITNFEVKGEVNNDDVTETVSLEFAKKASVESEAQRNFSGKNLTIDMMIKPSDNGKEMPLFSHGTNGKKLQLWLTGDYHLKAVVDEHTYTSTEAIAKGGFTQVAMTISQDSVLTFYNGGEEIGQSKMKALYNGTGPLIFGRTNETDRTKSQYYEGRMMEARLWYRALTGGLLGSTYGSRRLTGYEVGLVDYYPMNEGQGNYAMDHTQGANAELKGASWAMPRGFSLHLDWEDRGLALNQNTLKRTEEQDYTLMFWFKTDSEGRGVLLSNGAGSAGEDNARNQFNIAFEAEKLMYRTHGMGVEVPGDWSDNQWHHFAMTVNRSHGLANIYVDAALRSTFAADSLGGISGGHPLIGAALSDKKNEQGKIETIDTRNWLRGYIDELCLFEQALPATLIKNYSSKSPCGDEIGLLTYLSFDRQERQANNDIELVPYPYSRRIYKDDKGGIRYELDPQTKEPTSTPVRDYPFADEVSIETAKAHIDGTTAAPVVPYEELKNLTFSYVGKDNQVLVSVDEQTSRINRCNIYVTLRDIEDKNGNAMASPQTACYYVNNSNLEWWPNRETRTISTQEDSFNEICLSIRNNSAASHTYTIENCPKWLQLEKYSDIISPNDFVLITGTVSRDLNVGTYDEIIYFSDEEGVREPLYLNITVEAEKPDWAFNVPGDLLQHSMNIAGQVYLNDEIDIDTRDIIGAFDHEGQCHGFAHIEHSALTGDNGLYLTVYDNKPSGRKLLFKLWQYSTGRELILTADGQDSLEFKKSTVLGVDKPVRFEGGKNFVQTFNLKQGWNWISFNVSSEKLFNLNNLLDGLPWVEGDVLTDMNSDLTLLYTNGHWLSSSGVKNIMLSTRKAYAIKVQNDISFPVAGSIIKAEDQRTIELKSGWNGIGYTPMMNLSVETALSDYYDKAEVGDVVKSHNEFAYFTLTGGTGRWRGSLQYMKPGEGYMLLRKGGTPVTFRYPFFEVGSTFVDEWSYTITFKAPSAPHRSTMSVSAVIDGFSLEEGDRLVAYANGEKVGEAIASQLLAKDRTDVPVFYLSINGEAQTGVWFAIERDDEIVASTMEQMSFRANAVVGTPDEPTTISFARSDYADGKWYNVNGVQLPKRPTKKGIYIYNGNKVVIK